MKHEIIVHMNIVYQESGQLTMAFKFPEQTRNRFLVTKTSGPDEDVGLIKL